MIVLIGCRSRPCCWCHVSCSRLGLSRLLVRHSWLGLCCPEAYWRNGYANNNLLIISLNFDDY